MHIVRLDGASVGGDENCKVLEYPHGDADIDISTARINGRYPKSGYCVNTAVKEMIYVVSGSGRICKENEIHDFAAGDTVLIYPREKYYWDADCSVVMACNPAWSEEQHKFVQ